MWRTPTLLVIVVLLLLAMGIVMLASTSGIKAAALYDDPSYFVKRQALWLIVACMAALTTAHLHYRLWRPAAPVCLGLALAILALVLVPGVGARIGGSRRWLRLAGLSVQPSEFAKFAMVLGLAWWMAREKWRAREFWRGAIAPLAILGSVAGLIFLEPDFGTTLLCAAVGLALIYVGGARLAILSVFALLGLGGFALAVMRDPVRSSRILAFLNPEQYADTYAFQLLHALNAFIAGGPLGVGLGASVQKHYYLPEAHTDFIFAIIGEELGLAATLSVVGLFAVFFVCGLRISLRAPDTFGRLLAFGITLLITLQAAINIGVVTGLLPTKGLPLPFISAGGSSLAMSMLAVGVLYNIALHARLPPAGPARSAIADRVREI